MFGILYLFDQILHTRVTVFITGFAAFYKNQDVFVPRPGFTEFSLGWRKPCISGASIFITKNANIYVALEHLLKIGGLRRSALRGRVLK